MTQLVANDEHCQYYSTITEPCQVASEEKAPSSRRMREAYVFVGKIVKTQLDKLPEVAISYRL